LYNGNNFADFLVSKLNVSYTYVLNWNQSTMMRKSLTHPLKWLSLLGGTYDWGYEEYQWGSGISMRLLLLQCAYSENGGLLNSEKVFSLSTSTALAF